MINFKQTNGGIQTGQKNIETSAQHFDQLYGKKNTVKRMQFEIKASLFTTNILMEEKRRK